MTEHNVLFDPIEINNMQLKNKLVRSATFEMMATGDGTITDDLLKLYRKLAKGGVGLIITGFAYIQQIGQCAPKQIGIFDDDHIPGLKNLVDEIHKYDSKACLQIVHGGRATNPALIGGQAPIAPSSIEADPSLREMTPYEINETIEAFGAAAGRAKEAGFDAIQIHATHGYLIAQFLSPYTNTRSDEWGGSVENRSRFLVNVFEKAREVVGEDYPILTKLTVDEGLENGLKIDEASQIAQKMSNLGIDAIEVSGGSPQKNPFFMCRGDIPIDTLTRGNEPEVAEELAATYYSIKDVFKHEEAYWLPYAEQIKSVIGDVPLILVGGMKYPQTMEALVKENKADLISMCRALIREPNLPAEMAEGRKSPVKCAYCNKCLAEAMHMNPVKCYNMG